MNNGNSNNTQAAQSPSEEIIENDNNPANIDAIVSNELVITASTPLLQFNTANMIPSQTPLIPNPQQANNLTTAQEGRRRRRRRQQRQRRQQRRREERQQLQELQRRYNRRQPYVPRQQHQQERQREQIERQQLTTYRRPTTLFDNVWNHEYRQWHGPVNYLHESFNHRRALANESDRDELKERWEEEQMNELEAFAALEQMLLFQDEIEQEKQINAVDEMIKEEEQQVHQEQLIQQQLWDHAAFVVQQLNES